MQTDLFTRPHIMVILMRAHNKTAETPLFRDISVWIRSRGEEPAWQMTWKPQQIGLRTVWGSHRAYFWKRGRPTACWKQPEAESQASPRVPQGPRSDLALWVPCAENLSLEKRSEIFNIQQRNESISNLIQPPDVTVPRICFRCQHFICELSAGGFTFPFPPPTPTPRFLSKLWDHVWPWPSQWSQNNLLAWSLFLWPCC